MILGTIRQRLTRNDAQFALSLLVQGAPSEQAILEAALRDRGIDVLLDDPRLAGALLARPAGARSPLPLLVYVLVRRALRETNEDDRSLADFVSSIVLHFGLKDRANRVREHDDVRYDTLAGLAADAECGDPTRAFLVRAHMGHYALWLAGLFPDRIEAQHHRRGGPALDYFDEMGRRGYQMAAQHRLAAEHGVERLFETAAGRFSRLRVALNRLSDRVLFPHHHSADKLMRQVRDASG
ncbi:MAG: hypothetical protein ACT4P7_18270 [Gemmatimonadaceae bacterium]